MILTVYQSEKDVEISSKKFIANLHVFTVAKQTKLNTYQFNKVILFSTCIEKFYIKLTKHADAKLKWGNKRFTEVLDLNVFQIANVGQVCLRMGF